MKEIMKKSFFCQLFQPHFVVIPEEYTVPPPLLPHRTDLVVQTDNVSIHMRFDTPVYQNFNFFLNVTKF